MYDGIRNTRNTDFINNFWKALANDPRTLRRTCAMVKQVMGAPGKLDKLTRELVYIAVTNNCDYCIASHSASARANGMTDAMLGELLAIVATANATNRLAIGYRVAVDAEFGSGLA